MSEFEDAGSDKSQGKTGPLSFKAVGRPITISGLEAEFRLMAEALKNPLTPDIARRVCDRSGTHLVKLVSPRADGQHSVLTINPNNRNTRSAFLPSVNAPDIPFAKVIFRPLEVIGFPSASIVDHIVNPDDISESVLASFAAVFGAAVFEAVTSALRAPARQIAKLSAGEFPIIFIPSPKGGDLQITPVSPAKSFMGMKDVTAPFFRKQESDAPRVPRGRWHRQAVSAKPQNISGAIGGPRVRFLAEMPHVLDRHEAELHRYVHGGNFPLWRDTEVAVWVLKYATLLDRDHDVAQHSDKNTREGLDRFADRLIHDAQNFVVEAHAEAQAMAQTQEIAVDTLNATPGPAEVLLRRRWPQGEFDRARRVLGSTHFDRREKHARKAT